MLTSGALRLPIGPWCLVHNVWCLVFGVRWMRINYRHSQRFAININAWRNPICCNSSGIAIDIFNCLLQHHMVWQQLGKLFQYIHNSLVCRWPKDANDNGITNVKEKSILVCSKHWSADGLPCRRGCTCRCAWQWNSKNTFSTHWFAECLWMQMQMPTSGGEGGRDLHPHP